MGFKFSVKGVKAIKFNELEGQVGLDSLMFMKGYPKPKKNRWPKGHTLVYRNLVSVRPLDISFDGHNFEVKIFAPSAPEDYTLALAFIHGVVSIGGGKIVPENSHEMGLAAFKSQFNPAWVKNNSLSSFQKVMEGYHINKTPIKMIGTKAEIEIGPRMMEHLHKNNGNMANRFFERFRLLNYMDQEDVCQPSTKSLVSKNHGISVSLAEFREGYPTVINATTDLIGLKSTTTKLKGQITLEKMIEVLGNDALWLSENLLLAPGYKGLKWSKFLKKQSSILYLVYLKVKQLKPKIVMKT
jgi:hypothetical protein